MTRRPDQETFPFKEHLGFTVHDGEATGTVTLLLGERHMNPNGVAHGSVAFALMDTAMGSVGMSTIEHGAMSEGRWVEPGVDAQPVNFGGSGLAASSSPLRGASIVDGGSGSVRARSKQ